MAGILTVLALCLEILGVLLFSWAEVSSPAAFLRYSGTGEGAASFDRKVKALRLWRRLPLRLARRFGSPDLMAFSQEAVFDSFPKKSWGLALVVLGFLVQLVATILGMLCPPG